MKLVLAEKPSVAQSLAKVLGANKRCDGYLEGNGYTTQMSAPSILSLISRASCKTKVPDISAGHRFIT